MLLTITIVALLIFVALLLKARATPRTSICVMVLGDVGRSPRMTYHALSLAEHYGCNIDLIGLPGAPPHPQVSSHPRITIHHFTTFTPPTWLSLIPQQKIRTILTLICKVLHFTFDIIHLLLFAIERPQAIVLQTPPAIPLIFITCVVSFWIGAPVVVDWHNFGYTLLQMARGRDKPLLVTIAKTIEHISALLSTHNLCVTRAMQTWLKENWGVAATPFHDQPPAIFETFHNVPIQTKHELFVKLMEKQTLTGIYQQETAFPLTTTTSGQQQQQQRTASPWLKLHPNITLQDPTTSTLLTQAQSGSEGNSKYIYNPQKPFMCISSTSWTEDEDFSVLLKGLFAAEQHLVQYNQQQHHTTISSTHPQTLLCIITGKGETKQFYQIILDYCHRAENTRLSQIFDTFFAPHAGPSGADLFNASVGNKEVWLENQKEIAQLLFGTTTLHQTTAVGGGDNDTTGPNINQQFADFLRVFYKCVEYFEEGAQDENKKNNNNNNNTPNPTPFFIYTRVTTAWLDAEDYPLLLACCDVGVSLHQSSSGLDLPMKVVDMFGTALPCLATNFQCLDELVVDQVNGLVFNDYQQLAHLLLVLTKTKSDKEHKIATLDAMRQNLEDTRHERVWRTNWANVVKPIIDPYIKPQYHVKKQE